MTDSAVSTVSRSVHLLSRPVGVPTRDDFAVVEAPIPALGSGELLVRSLVMSVDPYMRSRMNDAKSYAPPFELDQPMTGGAVGVVVAANASRIPVGATVLHWQGWRDYAV
ncbi:MAG: NADP-dependent oxidoreductase, partial [Candidatus Nanopelagicales bacterium]